MKPSLLFLAAALTAVSSFGNPVMLTPRRAIMLGETVAVRLHKDVADVDAIYEFQAGATTQHRTVYFPLFAAQTESPAAVLIRRGLELELNGRPTTLPTPSAAPREFADLPRNVSVCWFAVDLDALETSEAPNAPPEQLVLKARFRQPLLHGKFYYVPLIYGMDFTDKLIRHWTYQLHAHIAGGVRTPRVSSSETDYEPAGDSVTVYLREGEVVILE